MVRNLRNQRWITGHNILRNEPGTIFCVLGDGELQEGQVWEGLMYYPKTGMKNMICIGIGTKVKMMVILKTLVLCMIIYKKEYHHLDGIQKWLMVTIWILSESLLTIWMVINPMYYFRYNKR